MSWSFSVTVAAGEDPTAILRAARQAADPASAAANYNARAESEEAIDAAIDSAARVVSAIRGSLPVLVQLSGHSNPGHAPVSGWSNDTVSINVSQQAN